MSNGRATGACCFFKKLLYAQLSRQGTHVAAAITSRQNMSQDCPWRWQAEFPESSSSKQEATQMAHALSFKGTDLRHKPENVQATFLGTYPQLFFLTY